MDIHIVAVDSIIIATMMTCSGHTIKIRPESENLTQRNFPTVR